MTTDDLESWFERGVTDGLPVVPPSRERVERMLQGTRRDRTELVGEMPPNYGRLTVEKAAINAVMAGCRPEYLAVVLAAAECACDATFTYTYCIAEHEEASHLFEHIRVPYRSVLPDEHHGEGTNLRFAKETPELEAMIPKFPSPEAIHVLVAGGTAGRFSMAIPGWLGTRNDSHPVTRAVEAVEMG